MSSTATAATNPTQPKSDIKPIGICLSANSGREIPIITTTNVTSLTSSTRNDSNSSNFYTSAAVSSAGPIQVGALKVMVANIAPNSSLPQNRQQTVILQPRINTTRSLQMNPIRGPTVISSQNLSSSLSSTTSSISVRTRVIAGQTLQTNPLPVLNLTTVTNAATSSNSSSTNTVKQMITGQKFITPGNVETVNLVMTNPSDVRTIRTNNTNEIKSNQMFTLHNVHNLNRVNGPKSVIPGSAIVAAQPKMISISNAGQSANVCQRLGILGTSVGNNKQAVINLPKSFIITSPNATLTASGAAIANMVSISSANFVTTGQATKISVTPNHIIAGAARHPVSSISITQSNLISSKPTIYTVATTNATLLNQVSSSSTTISPIQNANFHTNLSTTLTTSVTNSLSSTYSKPTIITTNISPIKPQLQANPSSPRPRILSRKRVQGDSPTLTVKSTNGSLQNATPNDSRPISNSLDAPNFIKHELKNESLNNYEANYSVRKKPRKQLLEPTSPKSRELDCEYNSKEDLTEKNNNNKQVIVLKPKPSLLRTYYYQHKSPPHFHRYSDVKIRPMKKSSNQEIVYFYRKQNDLKNNLLSHHLKLVRDEENSLFKNSLNEFLECLEKKISPFSKCATVLTLYGNSHLSSSLRPVDQMSVKLNDLTRANIQRSQIITDQLSQDEQRVSTLLTEHREKLMTLIKISCKCGYFK